MKLERTKFVMDNQTILLTDDCVVDLGVLGTKDDLPRDVSVSAFGKTETLKAFERFENESGLSSVGKFGPALDYAIYGAAESVLVVLGLFAVVVVSCPDKTIKIAAYLNRKEYEDQGFYWTKFLFGGYGVILLYESGALRFDEFGHVRWHQTLTWDDVFLETDDNYLYYSSEFGEFAPEDWTISIETGEKMILSGRVD